MDMDYSRIPSPCYLLDVSRLQRNLELIAMIAGAADVSFIPALKGFALWKAFSLFKSYIKGAAASGLYESRLVWEEMAVKAHTYSPAFIEEDFPGILEYSSHVTFNSLLQAEYFLPFVDEYNNAHTPGVSPGIRVNPGFSPVITDLYNPAAPGSRLGVACDVLRKFPHLSRIEGLHFHVLCESGAADSVQAIGTFETQYRYLLSQGTIKWVNFGGGHLVTRNGYDAAALIDSLRMFRTRYPEIDVFLEPGAAYVWDSGVLRARVVDVVEAAGIRTAILDVSFTAHMPDCLEMPYQPEIRGASIVRDRLLPAVPGQYRYRMGGNSCLAGDWLGDWDFSRELVPGDDIIFNDMIHYTMVKTTMFNGVKHPSIGIVQNGDFTELRRFGFADYKGRLA